MSTKFKTKEFQADFKKLLNSFASIIEDGMDELCELTVAEVQRKAPGKLKEKVFFRKGGDYRTSGNARTVIVDADYAQYVEYGRGPIFAKPGKMLKIPRKGLLNKVVAFFKGQNTQFIFTKRVGPQKAKPFFRPAVERVDRQAGKIFERRIQRAI